MSQLAVCIGCGCDDMHACCGEDGEPCHWLEVDYTVGRGVCSCCNQHLARWSRGERSVQMSVAKVVVGDHAEPYYIERNAMELIPSLFGCEAGLKLSLEWMDMTAEEFEALPQFEHIRQTKLWAQLVGQEEIARNSGDFEKADDLKAQAAELAAKVAEAGYDVAELADSVLE